MNQSRIKCPYCGEEIASTAKKCRFCGEWLPTSPSSGMPQPEQPQAEQPIYQQPQVQQPTYQEVHVQQPQPQQTQQPVYQQPQIHQSEQPLYAPAQAQQSQAPASNDPLRSGAQSSLENVIPNTVSFFDAYFVKPYIRQYADFKGVTSRKSFWLSMLALIIVNVGVIGLGLLLSAVANMLVATLLWGIWSLALVIPGIAIGCRRLRDAGKSPFLYFISLIPLVGPIILLIFWCKESQYDHSDENVAFKPVDIAVLAGCLVLLIGGFFALKHSLSQPSSNVSDDDLVGIAVVEEADTFTDDTTEVVSDYPETSDSRIITEGFDRIFGKDYAGYYGTCDGCRIRLNLNFDQGTGTYTDFDNGCDLELIIESYDTELERIKIILCNGKYSGTFEGRMSPTANSFSGIYTDPEGSQPFSLTLDTAP